VQNSRLIARLLLSIGLAACEAGSPPSLQTAEDAAVSPDAANDAAPSPPAPDAQRAPVNDAVVTPPDAVAPPPKPDAFPGPPQPDALVGPPQPDAAVVPTPDAAVVPTPDAAVVPTPDAFVGPPPPDAALPPLPDAAPLPMPDAALPPVPDAAPPPAPDAAIPPAPDAALPPEPDAAPPPVPDAASPDATPPPQCVPFHTADAGIAVEVDAEVVRVDADVPPVPLWPVDRTGLALELTLDGDFTDTAAGALFDADRAGGFAPANRARGGDNQSYGPTGETTLNGAVAPGLTTLPTANGLTFEGWFLKAGNNGSGTLFGFGDAAWGTPTLAVRMAWGELNVFGGAAAGRQSANYGRPGDCWHHVAVVFPPGFEAGTPWQVYLDGARIAATSGVETAGPGLFGAPFAVGRFTLPDGARMGVDEVRVWTRVLTPEEITVAATPQGPGPECRPGARAWEPGPRCVPAPAPAFRPAAEVRVLTDEWVAVYTDPTAWLLDRYQADCRTYLDAMERNRGLVADWWAGYQYAFSWQETRLRYEPDLLTALDGAWSLVDCAGDALDVVAQHPWVEAFGELSLPRPWVAGAPPQRTTAAEHGYVTYLHLPRPMVEGETLAVRDPWGYEHALTYSAAETLSWAFKANQLGYPTDAPKQAYLGVWLPAVGPLDLSFLDGTPFEVVREADAAVVFTGTIEPALSLPDQTGEQVHLLDFSALQAEGRYHLRVAGLGRSRSFDIAETALGEPFYTYARGLYHNRCAPLDPAFTPWARGDAHRTFRGGFAPLIAPENPQPGNDYADHSAEGWGFLDAAGRFVAYDNFSAVAATATDEALPNVTGGWHDAGDFDRRSFHLRAVEDLAQTYLLNPDAFTDDQLHLPESGNGRPDLLDEAAYGLEVWRQAQTPEGGVGMWIEATSHPQVSDPGLDPQPYYLALPTRNGTLAYARSAAMLSRALRLSGDAAAADVWLESAHRAFVYGTDPAIRVRHDFTARDGSAHHFIEAPAPSPQRILWAATELWLASGGLDAQAGDALAAPAMAGVFQNEVGNLWWRGQINLAVSVALDPAAFPEGWATRVEAALTGRAETWVEGQNTLPYRRAWYRPDHPYYALRGWGNDLYAPARELALAWKVTGDTRYRDGALQQLDYLHGNNPLGRVHVTGLGQHFAATVLHLPSYVDAHVEPAPGIPLYGPSSGVPHVAWEAVYGLVTDARADPQWEAVSEVMLPPSLAAEVPDVATLRTWLGTTLPGWRRFVALEQTNVPTMEFTVWETTAPAVQATGLLLPPGYRPPETLLNRAPRDAAAMRSARWIMP
jgi:hypothetical protein